VIALIGAAAFFFLKPSGEPKEGEEKKPAGEEEVNVGAIGKKPPGVFLETDKEIVVNIAGTEATRHLRTRLTFELESEAVKLEMEERDPQIKDILIDVLSSRTLEKLDNAESRDEIKKELIKRFNQVLKSGKVLEIFFTDYVIQ